MADLRRTEIPTNIEFLPNYEIPKIPLCKYLTDYEFDLLFKLSRPQSDPYLILKLLESVRIEPEKKCWFRTNDWSNYSHIEKVPAHRVSYEIFIGPLIAGKEICHHCDRKGCSNPWHLFQGTHSDNMKDAMRKGRLYQRILI